MQWRIANVNSDPKTVQAVNISDIPPTTSLPCPPTSNSTLLASFSSSCTPTDERKMASGPMARIWCRCPIRRISGGDLGMLGTSSDKPRLILLRGGPSSYLSFSQWREVAFRSPPWGIKPPGALKGSKAEPKGALNQYERHWRHHTVDHFEFEPPLRKRKQNGFSSTIQLTRPSRASSNYCKHWDSWQRKSSWPSFGKRLRFQSPMPSSCHRSIDFLSNYLGPHLWFFPICNSGNKLYMWCLLITHLQKPISAQSYLTTLSTVRILSSLLGNQIPPH